jgi:hypothetical protein
MSILAMSFATYASNFSNIMDKVSGIKDSLSVGAISVGLIFFLVMNIRKTIEEVKDVLEQVKIVSLKFKNDTDVQKLITETDELLETLATIAKRIGARKLAKKLSDIIQK